MKHVVLLLALAATPALAQDNQPGQHFIEGWDADGDGKVTLAELVTRRADVFYMFDENEDGMLSPGEYDLFDETRAADMETNVGHGKGMETANRGMERAFNDADGDGQVSEAEFAAAVPEWLKILDRDGDGAVTTADFGRR
ncbi:EF-hand domain-containing protein [Maritimibacter alkaliphilus]|uniref:EF-hand domain-containing protein n=1 Tax=Maritimibacter alkaliphilus TaxID=404236 RepID=UPI001C980AB3|nr:EF-hand domain-containing protein [Maritimibacter alkaliphilus]MBY6092227.1 EF-hand domain-containing protein [Maritimibacter alkaliphilus]